MTQVAWGPMSRRIGNTGMAVYPIALDGSVFGWAADQSAAVDILQSFADVGGNVISTADHYAGGRSEIMIGYWLERHDHRGNLVIATKIGRHPDAPGLSGAAVRRAVDASLERLGCGYVDLLSFDGDDPSVDVEETLTAAAELVAAGKVLHLSASGWSPARLREAIATARRLQIGGIEAVFTEYNLLERKHFEQDIAPIAFSQDLGVLARIPLANGYLRGDFRSRSDRPVSPLFSGALRYVGRRGNRVLAVLDGLAAETGRHVGQVALAWLLARPMVTAPVVRVKDAQSLLDLLPAVDLVLTGEQLERLNDVTG